MTHLNIGDIVKSKGFHEGYDETWQSYTVDEDRLLDYLEEVINPADGAAQTGEFIPLRYALVQTSRSAVQMGRIGWKRDRADQTSTGFILDHHDPSLFPERWVDLAVVLRCDNKVLHERLTER
jgi:adenylate kinase